MLNANLRSRSYLRWAYPGSVAPCGRCLADVGAKRGKALCHINLNPNCINLLTAIVLIFVIFCLLPVWSAEAQIPKGAETAEFNTSDESIGGLRLGLPEKEVNRAISCVPKKAREILEGATGVYVLMWNYPECGIVLKMSSERKGGSKTVESITIKGPAIL